ncbi:MAG: hypothetical protein ABF289_13865 [Clostridiales bacterium]
MTTWWNDLSFLQQVFYIIAIPSTLVLILQMILVLFGMDSHDFDVDASVDTDVNIGDIASFKFFSIQGLVAFFTMFGWTGVIVSGTKIGWLLIIVISTCVGSISMFLIALLLFGMNKLQSSGTFDYKEAIGSNGKVYIPIPKKREGLGKVHLSVFSRMIEADAVTDYEEDIKTGTYIRIIDVIDNNVMLVEKSND